MRRSTLVWLAVAAAVLVQIVYPLMPEAWRTPVTMLSVVVFASASLADVARRHGAHGLAALVGIAGGGGLAVEALGVRTGVPFGDYAYTGTLGPELLGVPAVVPLAWIMMAWPALVVGRTLARRPGAVGLVGGAALAAWDLFLDPQMVDAGHWRWMHPDPGLPLVPGVPLTNFAGWAVVAVLMVGLLHRTVGGRAGEAPSGPATALYLWAYSSSVIAHAAFFHRPGSALVGGLVMGAVAIPFAVVALRGPVAALRSRAPVRGVAPRFRRNRSRPGGLGPARGPGRGQQPGNLAR